MEVSIVRLDWPPMKLTSILAIYALFWTLSLFVILPIGVKTSEEMGEERGKGHADSAPHRHDLKRKVVWTTLLASVLFAVFYANYTSGWVTVGQFPVDRKHVVWEKGLRER